MIKRPMEKARIWCLEAALDIKFALNPSEISVTRGVSWEANETESPWGGMLVYGGGSADTLSFSVLLDESALDAGDITNPAAWATKLASAMASAVPGASTKKNDKSVAKTVQKFYDLTVAVQPPNEEEPRPPIVMFLWGKEFEFFGIVDNVTANYLLFAEDGTPKRATVSVSMKGRWKPEKAGSAKDFFEYKHKPKPTSVNAKGAATPIVDTFGPLYTTGMQVLDLANDALLLTMMAADLVDDAASALGDLLGGDDDVEMVEAEDLAELRAAETESAETEV